MRRTAVTLAVASLLICVVLSVGAQQSPKWQKFGGKVVSQNDIRFVLKDYDNDIWYHIDDQQKAGSFLGKNVLITGIFDGLTGTIRVQSIVEATPEQVSAANTERIKENTPPPPPKIVPPPPAVAANPTGSVPPRTSPPQQPAAPRLEARSTPAASEPRPAVRRTEAPISAPRPVATPTPAIRLPEEAVSASSTVAIISKRSILVPHNLSSQRPAKDLVVGRPLKRVSPFYPVEAKEQGIEGTVRLHAVISADGNVQSVQPVSGPESLVAAAVTAVREWRYGPTLSECLRAASPEGEIRA